MKKDDCYINFCMISFFVLANYFALIGLIYANKASKSKKNGDLESFERQRKSAKNWGIWGLIPSTIINVAIIYYTVVFILDYMIPAFQKLTTCGF